MGIRTYLKYNTYRVQNASLGQKVRDAFFFSFLFSPTLVNVCLGLSADLEVDKASKVGQPS